MAGVVNTARLSARIANRYAPRSAAVRRGFHVSQYDAAAQNYAMPALSPTMTEGNIAKWNIKEGDTFTTGDVLLEIETDKATMDVEAQDDGILMKITKGDGSKGVQVGDRIAVTAEPGDDISSLELPAEANLAQGKQEVKKQEPSASKQESKPAGDSPSTIPAKQQTGQEGKQIGAPANKKYPLYPSVETMLHQNGLSAKDADKIPATGPQGRLLKGDVLAFLGKINKDYPAQSSQRIGKLSHLDLSNIQLAKKAELKPEVKVAEAPAPPKETEIAVPISLSQVIATQNRVQDTLGIHLPLSTFITRASELANEDLPLSKKRQPTADELFHSIIGLDQVARSSRGNYFPQITGLSVPSFVAAKPARKPDIIDILTPKKARKPVTRPAVSPAGTSPADNIFSVKARAGDESRANEYLERLKLVLEKEPGRLVL